MNKIRTENYDNPSKGLVKISEDGSNDARSRGENNRSDLLEWLLNINKEE